MYTVDSYMCMCVYIFRTLTHIQTHTYVHLHIHTECDSCRRIEVEAREKILNEQVRKLEAEKALLKAELEVRAGRSCIKLCEPIRQVLMTKFC